MLVTPVIESDIPLIASLYAKGMRLSSQDAASKEILNLLRQQSAEPVSGQRKHLLVAKSSQGSVIGLLATGAPAPEAPQSGSALQLLAVPPDASGRRLGTQFLEEAKRHLLIANCPCLWIQCEEKDVRHFLRAGAIELGSAPATQKNHLKRRRLRLWLSNAPEELSTDRLLLRDFKSSDLTRWAELNADPVVNRFLTGPLSRDDSDSLAQRLSDKLKRNGFGFWAVQASAQETPSSNPFIGMIGLSPASDLAPVRARIGGPVLEIGWRLHSDSWGKGYATEGASRAIRYAFKELGVDELVSFTVPENITSQRVMAKLGFERDPGGNFEHPKLPQGHALRKHWLFRRRA